MNRLPLRRPSINRENRDLERQRRLEAEASFERLWLKEERQFDPDRNCMERLRIERTVNLIDKRCVLKDLLVVDLGVGFGEISKNLRDKGAKIDAVDIAKNPLDLLAKERDIRKIQDYVPFTHLEDNHYDLVLSTELIALLPRDEYRLFFSELSRLVKNNGKVVCSTLIDIYSEDAIQQFASFAETEFIIEEWVLSYHYLWTKFLHFFETPGRYIRAFHDQRYRKEQLSKKTALRQTFYRFNSSYSASFFWKAMQWVFHPIVNFLKENKSFLLFLESVSKFIWQEQGISHAIFFGKKRPLFEPPSENEQPIERKTKKIVWE